MLAVLLLATTAAAITPLIGDAKINDEATHYAEVGDSIYLNVSILDNDVNFSRVFVEGNSSLDLTNLSAMNGSWAVTATANSDARVRRRASRWSDASCTG